MNYPFKTLLAVTTAASIALFDTADAHGYLKSPRSRNFFAYEEMKWWDTDENDPEPESDPYSLNRGGTAAQCGMGNGRNYDLPKNALGGLMKANVQECYEEGSIIDLNVVLTAYHGGHFEFHACPITHGEVPTESCFKDHPLEFVEDVLNNAPKDPNFPSRAYIHGLTSMTLGEFRYKYKLPDDLVGELVLIQWYYVTGNTCTDEGYANYPFPTGFTPYNTGSSTTCPLPITGDGSEAPERFWNCAEVRITEDCSVTTTSTTTPAAVCTPVSQEELGWAVTAVSQNDCNKCALNNHESQYWPCDSNPPLCDCGLETTQGPASTTTTTTSTTTTTTTTTQAAPTTQPPTLEPTTAAPSPNPTPNPTDAPVTEAPTQPPTTANPTQSPTEQPTSFPTTPIPTQPPTTANPTDVPTNQPTNPPTTASPTQAPTAQPTNPPTTLSPTPVPTPPPTNQPITGSAGWYVGSNKCIYGDSTENLYTSASECCTKHLGWMGIEMCVSKSTGDHTNKFYADQTAGVCRQDCSAEDELPCSGSPTDLSLTFYSSLESCCATKIPWETSCVDKSNGNEPQGTGQYYVNWTYGQCSLDCPEGAAGCGGVASHWDTRYGTQDSCCSAISWVPKEDCVYT
jgi:hypothetical protein